MAQIIIDSSNNLIQGDFDNATVNNRTKFKTTTLNGTTNVYAVPNGSSTSAGYSVSNNADPTNASKITIATNGATDTQIISGINGTGSYLPMSFYTNNTLGAQLDTSGNFFGTGKMGGIGSVIQVVQASSAGGSTASTSFTDMGLSASITPTKSTSKILVQVNGVYRAVAVVRIGFSIVRGSTNIQSATEMATLPSASVTSNSYYLTVLDSPATTSSTTYKVQFQTNTGTAYTNDAGTVAVGNINYITLMEVVA